MSQFEAAVDVEERGMALARACGNHYRHALLRNRNRVALAHMGRVREARAMAAGTWESPAAGDALANECQVVVDWLAGDLPGALLAMSKARIRNRTQLSFRQVQFFVYGVRAAVDADRLEGIAELFPRLSASTHEFSYVATFLSAWAAGAYDRRLGRPGAVEKFVAAAERLETLGAAAESLYCLLDLAEAAVEDGLGDLAGWAATKTAEAAQVTGSELHRALDDLVHAIVASDPERARSAAATFEDLGYRLFQKEYGEAWPLTVPHGPADLRVAGSEEAGARGAQGR